MRVKLKNFEKDFKDYIVCKSLANKNDYKSFSIRELATHLNCSFLDAKRIVEHLDKLFLLIINDEDYPRADPWEDSYFSIKSVENLGLESEQEYLVIGITNKSFLLITDNLEKPSYYSKDLFIITDPTKEGVWIAGDDGKLECPEELNYPGFNFNERLWDGYLEARYMYFKYLKKIGLLQSDAKDIVDPKHEKAREERVTKQIEKRQLRDQNKSKYHFLAWLESKSILPEQSTDEQIMEAVMQTLKEIKQRS